MSDVVIRAEGLGKVYDLAPTNRGATLRETIAGGAIRALGRLHGSAGDAAERIAARQHWALRDVTFEVRQGETVGLVGANGSGKSTLLKIVSRIVAPTRGCAEIRGRVGALLEVGTGFHPELSGRDNIFLNGSILGMTRAETRRRFDAIVEFAGVERFLELPIKRYSSGMALRLGFAVAAHLEPDVLIVDEVLAVGDAEFQRKCLARMDAVSQSGCTVFFVSHNLMAVQNLCSRAILLERGMMVGDGRASDVISQYLANVGLRAAPHEWTPMPAEHGATGGARILAAKFGSHSRKHRYQPYPRGALEFGILVHSAARYRGAEIAVDIYDQLGTKLINADSRHNGNEVELPEGQSEWRVVVERLYLKPGRYLVGFWLGDVRGRKLDSKASALQIEVVTPDGWPDQSSEGADEVGVIPCTFEVSQVQREVEAAWSRPEAARPPFPGSP